MSNVENKMQEYWVNVYRYDCFNDYMHVCYSDWSSKRDLLNYINSGWCCPYRIHVKMKPVDKLSRSYPYKMLSGGEIIINRPWNYKYKQTEWADKLDWMG